MLNNYPMAWPSVPNHNQRVRFLVGQLLRG